MPAGCCVCLCFVASSARRDKQVWKANPRQADAPRALRGSGYTAVAGSCWLPSPLRGVARLCPDLGAILEQSGNDVSMASSWLG